MTKRASLKKGAVTGTVKVTVGLVFIASVIIPIIRMFSSFTFEGAKAVIEGPRFLPALKNTVVLTLLSTVIVIALAYLLAWCINRSDMKLKGLFSVVLVLPMLIPSISHGMGLITLFGTSGIITNLLGISGNIIYGPIGIVLGSVLYAFPVAFIMLSDVLKYEDVTVYEAADVLGISKKRQLVRITLPYLRKPLIAAVFSTFSLIVTDYGVPIMIGGQTKTISSLMYEEVIGQLDFGRGCFYGLILLIPALVAFAADILNKEKGTSAFVKKGESRAYSKARNRVAFGVCTLVSVFSILPIISFLICGFSEKYPKNISFTLKHFGDTLERYDGYLINSLVIALATALIGTLIAFVTAYLTARMRTLLSKGLHLLVLTFMAIPGIVLGLSYVMTFSGSVIYGTLFILIMVNTVHFISSPYLMMYNGFGKMNENLEAVGKTMGVSRLRMIKDVFLPQSFGTVLEMFSYLFVNCMMTISAVSFLVARDTTPISLMIPRLNNQGLIERMAIVSLLILVVNIIMKAIIGILKKDRWGYSAKKNTRKTKRVKVKI